MLSVQSIKNYKKLCVCEGLDEIALLLLAKTITRAVFARSGVTNQSDYR